MNDCVESVTEIVKKVKWVLRMHKRQRQEYSIYIYMMKEKSCSRITVTSFDMGCIFLTWNQIIALFVRTNNSNVGLPFLTFSLSSLVVHDIMFAVMHLSYRFVMLIDRIVACLRRIQPERIDFLTNIMDDLRKEQFNFTLV